MSALSRTLDPVLEDVIGRVFRGTHNDWQRTAQMADVSPYIGGELSRKLNNAHAILLEKMQQGSPYEHAAGVSTRRPTEYGTSNSRFHVSQKDIPGLSDAEVLAHSHPIKSFSDPTLMSADPLSTGDLTFIGHPDTPPAISAVDAGGGVSFAQMSNSENAQRFMRWVADTHNNSSKGPSTRLLMAARRKMRNEPDLSVETSYGPREQQYTAGVPLGIADALQQLNVIQGYGYRAGQYGQANTLQLVKDAARSSSQTTQEYLRKYVGLLSALGMLGGAGLSQVEEEAQDGSPVAA